ncbi:E3 ubiquitin-protein ligase MYCBP2-like isoform X2 [Lycorma delicatula]|uniref:E3 ubiquitin-protein ligase MYCBP2-like isoform X2 n=1 Tax=Lycorma delicatula TaxID=130591 RepID=UPI003F50EB6E
MLIRILNKLLDITVVSCHSNERLFLRDLVQCVPGTSGGRLSRWLQPDPYVDPSRCQVLYGRDDLRCGWPSNITILTKDQYGDLVYVPNLTVEVKAVPIDKKEVGGEVSIDSSRKLRRVSQPDEMTFGGHALPCIDVPYEVTVKDKMCYYAISIMKAYENYSFEELRYTSPAMKRSSENMLVRPNCDGSYSVTWTPGSVGWYLILTTIDGYSMDEGYKVEVKEPPQGLTPPNQSIVRKTSHQPNRLRKFVAKNSAGLRIRAHPSLQSEQIGIVHVNGTIAFVDEIHNDDGVWLRLNQETIRQYCSSAYAEAWCLQYNQHLGKTLLLPLQEPKSILDHVIKETIMRKTPSSDSVKPRPHAYKVILCGASGHNVRSKPSLKAPPIGMLVLGNTITVTDHLVNSEGTWVQLDKDTMNKYCFTWDGEAWSLASDKTPYIYLQPEPDVQPDTGSSTHMTTGDSEMAVNVPPKKGFDFSSVPDSVTPNFPIPVFTSGRDTPQSGSSTQNTNPFVFGSSATHSGKDDIKPYATSGGGGGGGGSRSSPVNRWLKPDDSKEKERQERKFSTAKDLPPELLGVSVKELVKAIGESRANGNGITPPDTPRRMSRSSSPHLQSLPSGSHAVATSDNSASSSPVPIPGAGTSTGGACGGSMRGRCLADSRSSSPPLGTSPRSIPLSPLVSAESGRRGSTQSDTSALVSSLTRDPTPSASPSPSSSSIYTPSDTPKKTKDKDTIESDSSSKLMAQAGTQTSPEGVKGHFSIGTGGGKDENKLSPKLSRKERPGRNKRTISPASPAHSSPQQLNNLRAHHSQQHSTNREPVKEALSPSVAESLRATFAAFLWHEGIVHDAMACASFLKFHPTLPKQGALVITRHTDRQRVTNQRHSVEVSTAGSYLHIKPSTLETLTRSAANANANRHRKQKQQSQSQSQQSQQQQTQQQQGMIKEEGFKSGEEDGGTSSGGGGGVVVGATASSGGGSTYQTVTVLPPALKCLVLLWEELTACCLQTFAANAVLRSPSVMMGSSVLSGVGKTGTGGATGVNIEGGKRTSRKKKEWKPSVSSNAMTNASTVAASAGANNLIAGTSGDGKAGVDRESLCELCGGVFPHPITYHMKQAHPGCGGHAGGKGYNSGGNYCVGWAGNCGDGGVSGSSWYLVCDNCRERYLKGKKSTGAKKLGRKKGFISLLSDANSKIGSPASSLPVSTEMHRVMKDNAMFLLELSGVSSNRNVNQSPPEQNSAFPPPGPFQCLYSLGIHPSQLRDDSHFLPEEMIQCRESRDIFTPMRAVTESPASDSDGEGNRGRLFHRSISMGTNGAPWSRQEGDGRIIMMRKRNNSTCEIPTDAGSSLLCHPSPALQKLVPSAGQSAIVSGSGPGIGGLSGQMSSQEAARLSIDILSRPVLLFLLEQHNLRSLQLAMKQALRKATCRVYAMQALNWLLRSVTQASSIHDLLWWLVAALTPATFVQEPPDLEPKEEGAGEPKPEKKDDLDLRGVCEHPLSDMGIVGQAVHPLPHTFHTLLQTVADLMVLLPMGSALQQMAVRCFGIHFTQADHTFLHRCHVFSNISKILSRSEEEQEDAGSVSLQESSHHSQYLQVSNCVETLRDLTHSIDIKASSRQAMVGSLTDNSTETFWESGDEDRNKTKMLTLTCPPHSYPRMIYIHIDNCRDLANKVSNVTFLSGLNCEELFKLRTVEVESRATGWLNCTLLDTRHNVLRLELKGPDNSLRLRQIRVLGGVQQHHPGEPIKYGRQHSAIAIQQHNTEAETLKVFRLITSQVFGKLITGEQEDSSFLRLEGEEGEESNDLKEHVVGILFSRSKLTHLQKQVCAHIVQAIRRETMMLREDWESKLCSALATGVSSNSDVGAPDTYCFEMLSMVLALSGSSVGRTYLAQQHALINDLLSLLHTGSARVQRQVTGLVRRMLPEVSPTVLANLTGVSHLPPTDFSIAASAKDQDAQFDCHRVGILDVFLSCIAKALTVQVKVKSKDGKGVSSISLATSIHPRDPVGPRWWIRGCISRRLAEDIIQLVKDMAAGKLSEVWARVTKAAIAENIINLTRLSEAQRNPTDCLRCPTLWIALASLCVLDNDHVERLSSTQWRNTVDGNPPPPRPTCSNHDDGETNAIIQCNMCGSLCADCDRFLHLHRRTRMHHRQVCKEEEEAIKVDLHEGCGRTKLFWALLLADSCTLKAMVEFREGARSSTKTPGMVSGVCRFCGATDNSGLLAIGNICADQECQEHGRNVCNKLHPCGHLCGGIQGETECLPCLHNCSGDPSLKQDADDMCMICFTEALSCAPALQLKCGHVFHLHCCRNVLQKKWAGPRITFSFSQCPICKAPMDHPVLNGLLAPIRQLYEDVRRKALMRLEYEGLDKGRADPATYAMDRYAYYVCFKCSKAYYGGEARCDAELGGSEFDPSELVCGACSDVSRAQMCPKHGTDFLEYKCRYCCSVAVFFCFGTTHFCNACHDDFQRVTNLPRAELPPCPAGPKAKSLDGEECPLHVKHPQTGEEFALGCGVCRNAHTF